MRWLVFLLPLFALSRQRDVPIGPRPGARYGCDTRATPPACVFLSGNTGDFCIESRDCTSGTCTEGTCLAGVGDFCGDHASCASGACLRQSCACSPFVEATCAPGEHCVLFGFEELDCVRSGSRTLGSECASLEDCAAPLFCAQLVEGQPPTCQQPCSDTAACASGATCFRPLPEIPFGLCPPP